jgi:uncharacterized protein
MHARLLYENDGLRTFVLVFDAGDRVIGPLESFAAREGIGAGHFTGIGAFERVELGYFELARKAYRRIRVDEQVELLSLTGDIALQGSDAKVHAHAVVGKSDAAALGGHLMDGVVRPTLELMLTELPERLRRRTDPATGLALLDPAA